LAISTSWRWPRTGVELLLGVDFIGQALEAGQRLLAQQAAIDHAETRRQMPEEQVFRDSHFRHQVQFLVDHRDAAGDAVGGAFEIHGLLADLHVPLLGI
jgi:predicted restriction endonuclease